MSAFLLCRWLPLSTARVSAVLGVLRRRGAGAAGDVPGAGPLRGDIKAQCHPSLQRPPLHHLGGGFLGRGERAQAGARCSPHTGLLHKMQGMVGGEPNPQNQTGGRGNKNLPGSDAAGTVRRWGGGSAGRGDGSPPWVPPTSQG